MNENRYIQYEGITIFQSDFLPTDEVRLACDIETKQEIRILTGEKIDLIQLGDKSKFIASKKFMDKFELELNQKNNLNKNIFEKDCNFCGKTIREQKQGCNEISCYRQFLPNSKNITEVSCVGKSNLFQRLIAKFTKK